MRQFRQYARFRLGFFFDHRHRLLPAVRGGMADCVFTPFPAGIRSRFLSPRRLDEMRGIHSQLELMKPELKLGRLQQD